MKWIYFIIFTLHSSLYTLHSLLQIPIVAIPPRHFIWVHPPPLRRIDCGQGGIFLRKARPIFYSAMMLTGVNLLLRFAGTTFQVYLSRRIGAEGIGLLQLTLSVGNLAMVAGMGGIRTATMYLSLIHI